MGSPISTWEGATAYFAFADSPALIGICLIASVALCVGAIVMVGIHESHAYGKIDG